MLPAQHEVLPDGQTEPPWQTVPPEPPLRQSEQFLLSWHGSFVPSSNLLKGALCSITQMVNEHS